MEYKGDWRDLFRGPLVAFNFRSMFLGLAGIFLTLVVVGGLTVGMAGLKQDIGTFYISYFFPPTSYAPHAFFNLFINGIRTIFTPGDFDFFILIIPDILGRIIYVLLSLLLLWVIWAFIGGAICRIAAVDIAKEGERIETGEAMKYTRRRYSSFFFPIVICLGIFLFFFLCNLVGGFIGRLFDLIKIGPILVALFLPLALLAGAVMLLIILGAFSVPLYWPAIATEGTDAFDALSRGFTYIYSKTWHYIWYLIVSAIYGFVFISILFIFTVIFCTLAIGAGVIGFDTISSWWGWKVDTIGGETASPFGDVKDVAFSTVLGSEHIELPYGTDLKSIVTEPHPYGRLMHLASGIAGISGEAPRKFEYLPLRYKIAAGIVVIWLLLVMFLFYGYIVSYIFTQLTVIYFILRKKVDGIELTEVFEEEVMEEVLPEIEEKPPEPAEAIPEQKPPEQTSEQT
jgi:hypothetical protein